MWKLFTIYDNIIKDRYIEVIIDKENDTDSFADVLARYILSHYEKNIVYKMLSAYGLKYGQFNHAYENIRKMPSDKRISLIKSALTDYIKSEDFLNLNGFIMFRLYEYKAELQKAISKSLDGMIAENEYEEFIELLKFFVDIQECSINTIHILYSDGKYILLDQNYSEITDDCISDLKNEINFGTINYDDLLLSTLISLSPKSIIIHNRDCISNTQLLITLEKVFAGKVRYSDKESENINLSQIKGNLYNLD